MVAMRNSLERPLFSLQVKRILHRKRVRDVLLTSAMRVQGVSVDSERTRDKSPLAMEESKTINTTRVT